MGHGQRHFRNQVARRACNDRSADDLVGSSLDVNSDKAIFFTFENGSINVVKALDIGVDCDALFFRLMFVQTDVSDFRRGIGIRGLPTH